MGLIIGSLFGGTAKTTTGARSFFGVSFLSIMFISMGAMPQLATTLMSRGCAAISPAQHLYILSLHCCRLVLLMLLCSGEQPHFTCSISMLNTALPWCCRVFYKQRDSRFFAPGVYAYAMAITHVTTLLLTPAALMSLFLADSASAATNPAAADAFFHLFQRCPPCCMQIPFVAVESIVYSCIVYFIVSLLCMNMPLVQLVCILLQLRHKGLVQDYSPLPASAQHMYLAQQ